MRQGGKKWQDDYTFPEPEDELRAKVKGVKCLTVWGHVDGFGGFYGAVLTGIIFAHQNGVPFKHTQGDRVAHYATDDPAKVKELDDFIGLTADPGAQNCLDRHHFPLPMDVKESRVAIPAPEARLIRQMYFKNSKAKYVPADFGHDYQPSSATTTKPPPCTAKSCDIVVHVRRGDIMHRHNIEQYVPDPAWLSRECTIIASLQPVACHDSRSFGFAVSLTCCCHLRHP